MKQIFVIIFLSVGLQTFRAQDEVTELAIENTEANIISEEVTFSGYRK